MSILSEMGIEDNKGRTKEEVLYSIVSCFGLIDLRLSRLLQPHGLSPVKMNALMMIKHIGGSQGLSQIEIGKRMIVTAGNITRLIDRMEKEGLVERVAEIKDRRVKRIKITKKGSDLLDNIWPIYIKEVHLIMLAVPDKDGARIVNVLGQVRKDLIR